MKLKKKSISLLMVLAMLFSTVSFTFDATALGAEPDAITPFSAAAFRRPSPAVTLDVTDVTRVGAAGDTTMAAGNTIKKATPSGVPYITGTYASQAYAGETPEWPKISFLSSMAVTITSITVTGGTVTPTLIMGALNSTSTATWELQGGTATAGSTLEIAITYNFTWHNDYTGVDVTDTYTMKGYSYVESIIFPAGAWVFTSAYSNVANAADVQYVSRILGRGVYGAQLGLSSASGDYQSGYHNFSTNSFAGVTGGLPERTMLKADPPHLGAYDQFIANGVNSYASGDTHRAKALIYVDTSVQTMQSNNTRMHFFIHGTSRSTDDGRDLTYETIHVRDGDVSYTGSTDNVLGTSSAGAKAALNPSGPVDGTSSEGGHFITAGMQTQSTLYGTGAPGTYTLITQWTGKGDTASSSSPNWMQYYHGVTIDVINFNKGSLRSALNSAVGVTNKTFNGTVNVTTINTANGTDPANGGVTNTGKGKNPQSWYYSAGWADYANHSATAWTQLNKPNTTQAAINTATTNLNSSYGSLVLRGANYSNAASQTLAAGLGNTFYNSSVKPLDTLVQAVSSADSSFSANLAHWKSGTYDYYTAGSRAALEEAYAAAVACQSAGYNVLYQPYVDYCAQQLQAAVNGLELKVNSVTFSGNGSTSGTMPVMYVTAGSTAALTQNVFARTGHTFQGWATTAGGSVAYTNGASLTMGAENITLYAVWSVNSYTITFDANGGTGGTSAVMQYNAPLTAPQVIREGYMFLGWTPYVPIRVPAENTTFTAEWAIMSYTIEFDANGGTGGTINTMTYGAPLTPPSVTKPGFTFAGWIPEVPSTVPAANTKYTAQWTASTVTITFHANGGTGGTSGPMTIGAPLTAPVVTRTGYTLLGWSPSVPPTVPMVDTVYTAQWVANNYTVNFDANGGSGSAAPVTQAYGTQVTLPASGFSKTGHTFIGWNTSPGATTALSSYTIPANNATLYAVYSINQYTVTFDANGGLGSAAPVTQNYGTPVTLPATGFTKTGHTFIGWNTSPGATAALESYTVPANNATLYAVYRINQYTVTFDASGGLGGTSGPMDYGSPLSAPTVTREGYTFAGWLPEVPSTVPDYDVTFVAQWTINSYTVSFDLNGGTGTVPVDQTGAPGSSVQLPGQGDITRPFYNFLGWAQSPSATVPLASFAVPQADSSLYAVWSRVPVTLEKRAGSTTVIDTNTGFIYGLEEGMTKNLFAGSFVQVNGDGRLVYTYVNDSFGTGTVVELIDNVTGDTVAVYTIILFGDIDGDGYITAGDENLIDMVSSYQIELDGEPFVFAADLTQDGFVDAFDLNIISAATSYTTTINQTNPSESI